jgi:hypothetical protein
MPLLQLDHMRSRKACRLGGQQTTPAEGINARGLSSVPRLCRIRRFLGKGRRRLVAEHLSPPTQPTSPNVWILFRPEVGISAGAAGWRDYRHIAGVGRGCPDFRIDISHRT